MTEKKVKAASTKCSGCGDDMVFSPDDACLKCSSCNSLSQISFKRVYKKHLLIDDENVADSNKKFQQANRYIACPNCGAKVVLSGLTVSSECPYCKTSLVAIKGEEDGKLPDAIVPFKISKQKAEEIFRKRLTKNWLVPSEFKKNISAQAINAFYFPSFVFNAKCQSKYSGQAYERYRGSDGEYHTRYFPIFGRLKTYHNSVEVESSTQLIQPELELVKPYDLSQAVSYQSEFVAGYSLECYNQSVRDCYQQAQEIIKTDIRSQIIKSISADGVASLDINTTFIDPTFSYCVLPIYRIDYQHKDKKYSNFLNGQTGALGGKVPKSGWKLSLTIILPILFVLMPILLAVLL